MTVIAIWCAKRLHVSQGTQGHAAAGLTLLLWLLVLLRLGAIASISRACCSSSRCVTLSSSRSRSSLPAALAPACPAASSCLLLLLYQRRMLWLLWRWCEHRARADREHGQAWR